MNNHDPDHDHTILQIGTFFALIFVIGFALIFIGLS